MTSTNLRWPLATPWEWRLPIIIGLFGVLLGTFSLAIAHPDLEGVHLILTGTAIIFGILGIVGGLWVRRLG